MCKRSSRGLTDKLKRCIEPNKFMMVVNPFKTENIFGIN